MVYDQLWVNILWSVLRVVREKARLSTVRKRENIVNWEATVCVADYM